MKGWLAILAALAAAVLTLFALYQAVRWFAALRQPDPGPGRREVDPEIERLEDEKRRLLNSLREVQFDHDTGKLDAADYKALRERYEADALRVMADLERRRAAKVTSAPKGQGGAS